MDAQFVKTAQVCSTYNYIVITQFEIIGYSKIYVTHVLIKGFILSTKLSMQNFDIYQNDIHRTKGVFFTLSSQLSNEYVLSLEFIE